MTEMVESGRIDGNRQAILVMGPHGQYTLGALCFGSYWVAKGWPFKKMACVVADVLLAVPVIGDYLTLVNTKPATEKVINGLLAAGTSIALYPGGIHEQVRTDADAESLYFPAKLSFVRLAIKHGVDLVPMYTFGENQLWPTSNFSKAVNMWVYGKIGLGNILLHSPILNLPTSALLPSPLLMPAFKSPVHFRAGDPVRVGPANDNPSEEKVQAVFETYVASVMTLFDEHKDECLPPAVAARGLTIVLRGGKHSEEKLWKSAQASPASRL